MANKMLKQVFRYLKKGIALDLALVILAVFLGMLGLVVGNTTFPTNMATLTLIGVTVYAGFSIVRGYLIEAVNKVKMLN